MKYTIIGIAFFISLSGSAQNLAMNVIDTDFSKGRLSQKQTITLEDVAKFHGHLCDGLAVGFIGLRAALYKIYPDSIIDRTNTRIVSTSSPCLTDIAVYLTGGRYQFNSFYVSDSISHLYIVQRVDNGKSVAVKLKSGIKPSAIDSLGKLASVQKLSACAIDSLHKLENQFLQQILTAELKTTFHIEDLEHFIWSPILINSYIKTDIVNKAIGECFPAKK